MQEAKQKATEVEKNAVNRLLDEARARNQLKNDAALSYFLRVAPPVISKLRSGMLKTGPSMILKLHEIAGMDIIYIRRVLAGEDF